MTSTTPTQTPSVVKVLTALTRLGEATAAGVAQEARLAYSTTTPRLRELEKTGHAEPFRASDGRTLWRATDAGREAAGADIPDQPVTAVAVIPDPDTQAEPPHESDDQPDGDPGEPTTDDGQTPAPPDTADDPSTVPSQAAEAEPANAAGGETAGEPATILPDTTGDGQVRRPKGALRGAVVDILENNPDRPYKVAELCRLINQAEAGTGMPKASQGAVANVLHKLAGAGIAIQTVEKPATFQLAGPET